MDTSKKFFQDALERRSKRLAHLVEISAPPQMISDEIMLVVQAAMGFSPEEVSRSLANWLIPAVRRDAGFCRSCDTRLSPLDYQCPACMEASENEETIKIGGK